MTPEELAPILHDAYVEACNRSGADIRHVEYNQLPVETQSIMLYMAMELMEDDSINEEELLA